MSDLQELPRLQFPTRPTPSPEIGEKGELIWLPLTKLRVDPTYQRAILDTGKNNIRRMIEEFSWLLFGTLAVARRPGDKFAVIDGQHRATAAMLHGKITAVPCLVLKGGPQAEARAFSAINGNVTRIHILQSFRAKVAGGDAGAVALVDLCAQAGVSIAPYPKTELKPGETLALGGLRICLKRDGARCLVSALKILRTLDVNSGLSAPSIVGSSYALRDHTEWHGEAGVKLAAKIAGAGKLLSLGDKARARKATRGGTEWASYTVVLAEALSMATRAGSQDMKRLMGGR